MPIKHSAGILLFRRHPLEVLLVHPGGPFWARKDAGAWSIPKGEYEGPEDPFSAACREMFEELGVRVECDCLPLGEIRQSSKVVTAWACERDFDTTSFRSNTFELEWPPRSGKRVEFPEVDRAEWFPLETAREKLLPAQHPFLDRLLLRVTQDAG